MSNSSRPPTPSSTADDSLYPRAIIHKRILDAAESDPDASLEELSEQISGATTDIVGRVLDDYGDPAESEGAVETHDQPEPPTEDGNAARGLVDDLDGADSDGTLDEPDSDETPTRATAETGDVEGADTAPTAGDGDEGGEPDSTTSLDSIELTRKQHDTLEAIADHPEATQRDLAELLGVTPSTVNYRLNSIPEFEWEERREFVPEVLSNGSERAAGGTTAAKSETGERATGASADRDDTRGRSARIEALEERVERLERTTGDRTGRANGVDPALVHQILRACMAADFVTEEDERRIVEAFVATAE